MKYRNLVKGKTYTVIWGRKVRRGVYRSRYFNAQLGAWHYVFDLGLGCVFTPVADSVEAIEL